MTWHDGAVLLTVTTTHMPATDLGHLLVKHPDRVHRFDLPAGTAYVCFPEATPQRCTAALILDADRSYAASSLLAVALNRAFRTALRGDSKDRPELAATPIPLQLRVPVLPCDGAPDLAERLFAPLGWTPASTPIPLDTDHPEWGDSRFVDLTLTGTVRLADALNHLYVLLPVLDDAKHYWVASDEVEKLLRAGGGWLAGHPERGLITRRYLRHRRALADQALAHLARAPRGTFGAQPETARLAEVDETVGVEKSGEHREPLAAQRRAAVLGALAGSNATRVLDLGCGSGALLAGLVRDKRYTEIVGVDIAPRALELAERRLRLDQLPERQKARIRLLQSALTYADDRLRGFDAAVLMEVIEHLDAERLPALEAAVLGHAKPATVIVTTPNVEYNVRYEGLAPGAARHHDHRFEWTRSQFAAWANRVATRHGYRVSVDGIGEADPDIGAPTQLAVFQQ